MQASLATTQSRLAPPEIPEAPPADRLSGLGHSIEHAAHLLPAQGPITVFVHHNTLHAFEDVPFEQAVVRGLETFGCQPYLAEDRYRQMLRRDRIRLKDLQAVLKQELGGSAHETLVGLCERLKLRLGMLRHPLRSGSETELRWLVAETDALRRFREDVPRTVRAQVLESTRHWILRDVRNGIANGHTPIPCAAAKQAKAALSDLLDRFGRDKIEQWSTATWESVTLHALWRAARHGVHGLPREDAGMTSTRPRDALLAATGADSDQPVNEFLIRFCAAFLDQGLSGWTLPKRELGFYHAFLSLYRQGDPSEPALGGLSWELRRIGRAGLSPLESIQESLSLLGIKEAEQETFLSETLLALRGWAGMIWQMETRGDRAAQPAPSGSLVEYVAVRLIVERLALAALAKESLGFTGPLAELKHAACRHKVRPASQGIDQRTFLVFQVAQIMGWTPEDLFALSKADWAVLLKEIEDFSELERRRVFHLAYERRYRIQALDAISIHADQPIRPRTRPRFQICCCIDDREESFRRHLEEVAPNVETFGAAGFFGTAMYYRGAAEAHFTPLCPIIIRPNHWVVEDVPYTFEEEHNRRRKTRKFVGEASRQVHFGSRTLTGGMVTALLGSLASIPLVARVLFPRFAARILRRFGQIVEPPMVRQLVLERTETEPAPQEGHIGFSVEEMADIVERVLQDIGLTSQFARLVIFFGHGSSSVNNPHESAYNCGACSGARGGPNARAFAQMANDPRVRDILSTRGLDIPPDSVFLGAFHNTCDDSVVYFDLDRLPTTHRKDFSKARRDIDLVRQRNAHERCRRFEAAPLNLSPEAALKHVEGRSEDLAQVRPEYNHATNAITYVGRRSRTRGLFLDRRTFLTSYDPAADDPDYSILTRILKPVIPVCAGIGLEYYFSSVDPEGYGSNNKLPHNVVSMLGVMLGAASDLQPGLNTQMTEIHEPMRPLFIVETTPEAMRKIIERNPDIGRMCRNRWVQLATLDPESPTIHLYENGEFQVYLPETNRLPVVAASVDWYRGWRDHLGFAQIVPPAETNGKVHTTESGGCG